MIARACQTVFACIVLVPCLAFGQDDAASSDDTSSNSTGVNILIQALNATGISDSVQTLTDFTATGRITYFWGGEEVSGPATVRGRIGGQFRLDAALPNGTRSISVSRGAGLIKEPGGEVRPIPLHNAINMDTMTFPYLDFATTIQDPRAVVTSLGAESLMETPAQKVRIQKTFPSDQDPDGTLANLCRRDYFFDSGSGLLLKTLDWTHPAETLTEDYLHEMEYGNYATFQGVRVPTLIREKVIGQTTWELQISNTTFNDALTDMEFVIQ